MLIPRCLLVSSILKLAMCDALHAWRTAPPSTPKLHTGTTPPIALVGGGLAGLTLSVGLARHSIPHTIYESALAFAETGAGISLGPNSIAALEPNESRISDVLSRCVSYNEGLNLEGKGVRSWMYSIFTLASHQKLGTRPPIDVSPISTLMAAHHVAVSIGK